MWFVRRGFSGKLPGLGFRLNCHYGPSGRSAGDLPDKADSLRDGPAIHSLPAGLSKFPRRGRGVHSSFEDYARIIMKCQDYLAIRLGRFESVPVLFGRNGCHPSSIKQEANSVHPWRKFGLKHLEPAPFTTFWNSAMASSCRPIFGKATPRL